MNWHFAPAEKVVMRLSQFIGVHNPDLNLHSYDIKNIMEVDFMSPRRSYLLQMTRVFHLKTRVIIVFL